MQGTVSQFVEALCEPVPHSSVRLISIDAHRAEGLTLPTVRGLARDAAVAPQSDMTHEGARVFLEIGGAMQVFVYDAASQCVGDFLVLPCAFS